MDERELTLAGIDMPELMDRLMKNTALVKIIIKKFIEDKNYEKLVAAIAQGDMAAAASATHTLKGMCGNLSLKELFRLFSKQMELFRGNENDKAVAMMEEITPRYEEAIAHMRTWVAGA